MKDKIIRKLQKAYKNDDYKNSQIICRLILNKCFIDFKYYIMFSFPH